MGENYKITYDFQLATERTNIKEISLEYAGEKGLPDIN